MTTAKKRGPRPFTPERYALAGTEFAHQVALFAWAALAKQQYPELEMLFAIKNEEKSGSAIVGGRFKASGVKAGVPDVMLPIARQGVHGLFIELKKPGGKARKEQIEFGGKLQNQKYGWCVCDSWEKAKDVILMYLGRPNPLV